MNTKTPLLASLLLSAILELPTPGRAATVTGHLQDISLQSLDTRIVFTPTNEVLITAGGLSAGPARVIDTSAGSFSLALDAGDYTVSLPLIPLRHPFRISVPVSSATFNITNLLDAPLTYTYTNNLDHTVKVEPDDAVPAVLDTKLRVAGSLTKLLTTNSGAVTLTISNNASGGGSSGPWHVNVAPVSAWSTNGALTLLDTTLTLSAGTLTAGACLFIDAAGSIADPGGNAPNVTFFLKLGGVTVVSQAALGGNANWYLHGLLVVRSAGASGQVAGTIYAQRDDGGPLFPFDTQLATINTTGSLTLTLEASIDNFTLAERVLCQQLIVH
jgi:hypothetical protein